MLSQETQANCTYFKRYRMETDLLRPWPPVPPLPEDFSWQAWSPDLLEEHARIKQQSFVAEIDAVVFPNLSHGDGCLRLMREISSQPGFCPEATWLVRYRGEGCGTIQGISDRRGTGVIQNLGVIPPFRGRGLGTALLLKALHGFRLVGMARAELEVTAQNEAAVRLYRKLGFRRRRTLYKPVETVAATSEAVESTGDWWL